MMSHSWRRLCGSRPVVGSSRKRIFGLPTSAVATARRWRWPPESLPTQAVGFLGELEFVENLVARARMRVEAGEELDGFADTQLFGETGFLERDAKPLAQFALMRLPGLPEDRRLLPTSVASRPSRISMVVVFPAPLGPSRPKHSPVSMAGSARGRPRLCRHRFCADRGTEWREPFGHFSVERWRTMAGSSATKTKLPPKWAGPPSGICRFAKRGQPCPRPTLSPHHPVRWPPPQS